MVSSCLLDKSELLLQSLPNSRIMVLVIYLALNMNPWRVCKLNSVFFSFFIYHCPLLIYLRYKVWVGYLLRKLNIIINLIQVTPAVQPVSSILGKENWLWGFIYSFNVTNEVLTDKIQYFSSFLKLHKNHCYIFFYSIIDSMDKHGFSILLSIYLQFYLHGQCNNDKMTSCCWFIYIYSYSLLYSLYIVAWRVVYNKLISSAVAVVLCYLCGGMM